MRCKFCGSLSIHPAKEHRNYSTGKAIAGAVAFGPVGSIAGMHGKDISGYRCGKCGAFMDKPMDAYTESKIKDSIYKAEAGKSNSSYDFYKQRYPNIEDVVPKKAEDSQRIVKKHHDDSKNITAASVASNEETKIKRKYQFGRWHPDCPVYISEVIIKTKNDEDLLSLRITNQADKLIRSLYLQATIYDDAGDQLTSKQCVYQAANIEAGNEFAKDTLFGLGTDLAYSIDVYCEKVVFGDSSVWRGKEETSFYEIPELDIIDEEEFPRFHYFRTAYLKGLKRNYSKRKYILPRYMPLKNDDFWVCTCGMPVRLEKSCPVCGYKYDELLKLMSQETLRELQLKKVKEQAAVRASKTVAKHNDAVRAIKKREEQKKEKAYTTAFNYKNENTVQSLKKAISEFENLGDYKDSIKQKDTCCELLKEELKKEEQQAEIRRIEEEKQAEIRKIEEEEREKRKKANMKRIAILAMIVTVGFTIFFIMIKVVIPNSKYKSAVELLENEQYDEAISIFEELGEYKDSKERAKEAKDKRDYIEAMNYYNEGDYDKARVLFKRLGYYSDSADKYEECQNAYIEETYENGIAFMEKEEYDRAIKEFEKVEEYNDSKEKIEECQLHFEIMENNKKFSTVEIKNAINNFYTVGDVNWDKFSFFINNRESFPELNSRLGIPILCSGPWNAKYYCNGQDWKYIMTFNEDGTLITKEIIAYSTHVSEKEYNSRWEWEGSFTLNPEVRLIFDVDTVRIVNDDTIVLYAYDKPYYVLYR